MRRQTGLVVLALATAGFAVWRPPGPRDWTMGMGASGQEIGGIHWPAGVRVLHAFSGEEDDHLGIGLAALGDVNGDGVGDYALGAMKYAYCFGFGPGYVRVHSGRDGSLLYRVDGTDGEHGDAYGDTIASVGDVDGDGVPDWAAGAWRWNGYNGYVVLYSGATGSVIWSVVSTRDGPSEVLFARMPPPSSGDCCFGPGVGGSIAPAGDVDGDGAADCLIGGGGRTNHTSGPAWILSGRTGEVLRIVDPRPIERRSEDGDVSLLLAEGDVNGDGSADELTKTRTSGRGTIVSLRSGVDGREIWHIESDEYRFADHATALGDLDGDGRGELLISDYEADVDGIECTGAAYVLSFRGE